MFIAILQHAPTWAWALLAGLVAAGILQLVPRQLTLQRATLLPLALAALSLAGLVATFGWSGAVLVGWIAGVAKTLLTVRVAGGWRGIEWSAATRRVLVPGSWVPLALLVGLFAVKFAVGATLALHPEFAARQGFASLVALAYGGFSGLFLSRGLAMWRVSRSPVLA